MTNADVIRKMTDDELFKFLQAIEVGDIDYSLTFCSFCKEDNQLDCDECFKRWLFGDADDYNGLLKDKGINSGYAERTAEQTEPSLEQFRVGLEYHTDAMHFGKAKGESITTDKTEQTEPQTDCLTCRYNSDEWDSPKCDGCTKAHSNYEQMTDCAWK